jgi:hypothetical protein
LRAAEALHGEEAIRAWHGQESCRCAQRARAAREGLRLYLVLTARTLHSICHSTACTLPSHLTAILLAERAARRVAKAAAKQLVFASPDPSAWQTIDGAWAGYAADGRGHRPVDDTDVTYIIPVPVVDFGPNLPLGGQARFLEVYGGDLTVHTLPSTPPPPESNLAFHIRVAGPTARGRVILVSGLQIRASPPAV